MLKFDKMMSVFWPCFMTMFGDQEKLANLKEALPAWEKYLVDNMAGKKYLGGTDEPMMIDMHIFPVVERLVFLKGSPWNAGYVTLDVENLCPQMIQYVHRFREHPKMSAHVITADAYNKHLEAWQAQGSKVPLQNKFVQ